MRRAAPEHLALHRFPIEPWRFVEREYDSADLGVTETLFAVGNGYLGMRANPEEGREAHSHGTYINGFHETWHIHHAEDAFGFAKTGQTIVNVPDAKLMKLYVDDEPLLIAGADVEAYERAIDFRDGVLTRDLVWRTPAGKRVRVRSQRLVSLAHRHLAMLDVRGHPARRSGPCRRVVAVPQPPGRRGRVPRRRPRPRQGGRPAQDAQVRPPRPAASAAPRAGRRGRARLPLRQQRDDDGLRLPPPHRHARPALRRDLRRTGPRQDGHLGPHAGRSGVAHRQAGDVPHLDRRARGGARRPLPPHTGPGDRGRP